MTCCCGNLGSYILIRVSCFYEVLACVVLRILRKNVFLSVRPLLAEKRKTSK